MCDCVAFVYEIRYFAVCVMNESEVLVISENDDGQNYDKHSENSVASDNQKPLVSSSTISRKMKPSLIKTPKFSSKFDTTEFARLAVPNQESDEIIKSPGYDSPHHNKQVEIQDIDIFAENDQSSVADAEQAK